MKINISPRIIPSISTIYSDPYRVIMEFIDNALDAAEEFYDSETKAY